MTRKRQGDRRKTHSYFLKKAGLLKGMYLAVDAISYHLDDFR